jgi:signal peptidase II
MDRFIAWFKNHYAHPLTTRLGQRGLILAFSVLLFDQVSKHWILNIINLPSLVQVKISPYLSLSMVWNRGVSFGLLASDGIGRWLLVLFSLGVAAFLLDWVRRATRPVVIIGLGLIAGGAIGNAIDRIQYGAVVDFIDISGLGFPWVFNIADAAINIGVICLFLDVFILNKETPKNEKT